MMENSKISNVKTVKKILIIDDSEVNLFLIQSLFDRDPDVQTVLESNSKHALPAIREGMPDLVVLDLMMPYVDGYKILQQLHSEAGINHIPVVVVSAREDRKSVEKALAFGAIDYIKKPINLADVKVRLRKFLYS